MPDFEIKERGCLSDAELRRLSRELFIELDMIRAAESDYETAVKLLRLVYDAGRSRGMYEHSTE